jgi:hypothetical protein
MVAVGSPPRANPQRPSLRRRPVWWHEAGLVLVAYVLYSVVRNAIHPELGAAERHGLRIQRLQDALGISWERALNHAVAAREWLAQPMDYYYASLHFVITPVVLAWLFLRHPHVYRGARTVLFSTTLLALACFYLYPVAPPRLVPGLGYVDTVVRFHTWGSLADPQIAERSNQYAAMPSLHLAWAAWCAVTVFVLARRSWVRALAVLYPVATVVVILGTGNHFVLDAVGGVVVLVAGFGVQRLVSGRAAYATQP